jgi:eukaryotic-like serine/threonine-protein kinase
MFGSDSGDVVRRAEARVGTLIKGKWTIDRLIGVGGMAAVYAATHRNKKRAAIKMLHSELSIDTQVRARFLREGYLANSVEHPGAVRVDDDDVAEDGAAFLIMELLEGESAETRRTREGGRLTVAEGVRIADQLLDILSAAHEKGIVHRDLKPDNLFLDRGGQVKVLDFGIARLREMRELASATQTGSLMGTPAFMAPEQARGRWDHVDASTDLWAVGATLFTLLTGHFVHEAETANETLALAITQPSRSILSLLPDLEPEVAQVIDRALSYDKANRYESALAMQQALRAAPAHQSDRLPELALPSSPVSLLSSPASGPTAATPSEVSASGADLVPTLTTGALTTVLAGSPSRTGSRKRAVAIAAGGGVLLAAVVAISASLSSRAEEPRAEAIAPSAAPAEPTSVPSPIAVTPVVAPSATNPAPASSDRLELEPPDVRASARPLARPRKKIGSKAPPAKPSATAAALPATAPPTLTAPPEPKKRDPFSKRQ